MSAMATKAAKIFAPMERRMLIAGRYMARSSLPRSPSRVSRRWLSSHCSACAAAANGQRSPQRPTFQFPTPSSRLFGLGGTAPRAAARVWNANTTKVGVMQKTDDSMETPYGWTVAWVSLLLTSIGWGAQYVAIVGLKPMAAEFDWPRSVPSLIPAMATLGAGCGGIVMGWWADRVGPRIPVMLGAVMIGAGALLASQARGAFDLYMAYGLMIGFAGNGTTFAPLMSNATRWFDKNRGVAVSIVASGQSVPGGLCPPLFRWGIDAYCWPPTLIFFGPAAPP